jgi:beta-lactamase class D
VVRGPGWRERAASGVARSAPTASAAQPPREPATLDIRGLTEVPACFVVRAPDGTVRQSDAERCAQRLRPASTFKIPNALFGADAGLIDGPDAVLTYDAHAYPRQEFWPADWAQDQTLRQALRSSAVPLFRRLARQIGARGMQARLDAVGYGNRSMAGGDDRFWLEGGGLAISAVEQVDFLARLVAGELPVSEEAHEIVRAALPAESDGEATLRFKTGTAREADRPWVAWLVGWVERPDGVHEFACWLQDPGDFDSVRSRRLAFCKGMLERLGLFHATQAESH